MDIIKTHSHARTGGFSWPWRSQNPTRIRILCYPFLLSSTIAVPDSQPSFPIVLKTPNALPELSPEDGRRRLIGDHFLPHLSRPLPSTLMPWLPLLAPTKWLSPSSARRSTLLAIQTTSLCSFLIPMVSSQLGCCASARKMPRPFWLRFVLPLFSFPHLWIVKWSWRSEEDLSQIKFVFLFYLVEFVFNDLEILCIWSKFTILILLLKYDVVSIILENSEV